VHAVSIVFTCLMSFAAGGVSSGVVDLWTLCAAGFHSLTGTTQCVPCGLGRANAYVGQVDCACCAAGTFSNVSGLTQCFPCSDGPIGCQGLCTSNPSCSCTEVSDCDLNGCSSGCFFQSEICQRAPAGSYTRCKIPSNCSASSNLLEKCPPGSASPAIGASSNTTCTPCQAGTYCPEQGTVTPTLCKKGYFSKLGAEICELCPAGTFSSADASPSCKSCKFGTHCPKGSTQPCSCPVNSYSDTEGAENCSPCLGQAEPLMGQRECVSLVLPSGSNVYLLYHSIIGIFVSISLGSVVLVVILVRSRRMFSVRPFHSGICIYIASFAPYALLKAVAVYKLLNVQTQEQQLINNLMISGTFLIFFCLGFGGKMALIQLWMHLISRHTSNESEQSLMASARQTWKFMRRTVLAVCIIYSAGFASLVSLFALSSSACAAAAVADSKSCIPLSLSGDVPPDCLRVVALSQGITYYEGLFAAVVAVIFMFYSLLFNGLAYALLTSDPTFSNLTKVQRILISNKFLRWMMSPCVHMPLHHCYVVPNMSLCASGSFPHRGSQRRTGRRATWSYGAAHCVRLAPSWPSSACAASRARPFWWHSSTTESCLMAAACISASLPCLLRRFPRC
jgi:hypothetical protein